MNYMYIQDAERFTFFRMPKSLFSNPLYKNISLEAKVLYGILFDRTALSIQNNWVDKDGRVFIYFSRAAAMEMLQMSNKPIIKAFKELGNVGLIEEVRQGLKKANRIYVGMFETCMDSESHLKCRNDTSRSGESTLLEVEKVHANKTEVNKTEKKENNNTKPETKKPVVVIPPEKIQEVGEKIQEVLGANLSPQAIIRILRLPGGEDQINHYLKNWKKFMEAISMRSVTSTFVSAVTNNWEIPQSSKIDTRPPQARNYEQRKYSDEFLDSLYENL